METKHSQSERTFDIREKVLAPYRQKFSQVESGNHLKLITLEKEVQTKFYQKCGFLPCQHTAPPPELAPAYPPAVTFWQANRTVAHLGRSKRFYICINEKNVHL